MGASGKDMAPLEVESENARITAQPQRRDCHYANPKKVPHIAFGLGCCRADGVCRFKPNPVRCQPGNSVQAVPDAGQCADQRRPPVQYQPEYPYLGGLGIYHQGHGHRH